MSKIIKSIYTNMQDDPQEPCEDAISRAEALKSAECILASDSVMKAFCMMKMLEELPLVTPSRHKGHWIDIYGKNGKTVVACRCSECGESPKHAIKSKFCPNCGNEMESKE